MLPDATVLGVPLSSAAVLGVPYRDRLSVIHFPIMHYVHQLYESVEYTDLLLKGHSQWGKTGMRQIMMLCGTGWGIDNTGMPAGLQKHWVLTSCQEAGTVCLAQIPLLPSLCLREDLGTRNR